MYAILKQILEYRRMKSARERKRVPLGIIIVRHGAVLNKRGARSVSRNRDRSA